jgi:hypothetical protein
MYVPLQTMYSKKKSRECLPRVKDSQLSTLYIVIRKTPSRLVDVGAPLASLFRIYGSFSQTLMPEGERDMCHDL